MKTKNSYFVGDHMVFIDSYIRQLTLEDMTTVALSVFEEVDDVCLFKLNSGARILQFVANGELCRYEIKDFGLAPVRPGRILNKGKAKALKLDEMYRAYINFMKTAKYENGELRFPNYELDLNLTLHFSGFNLPH